MTLLLITLVVLLLLSEACAILVETSFKNGSERSLSACCEELTHELSEAEDTLEKLIEKHHELRSDRPDIQQTNCDSVGAILDSTVINADTFNSLMIDIGSNLFI